MSSNIAVTPGVGATVSTDEITTLNGGTVAAQQVQRIKLTVGAAGVGTDVSSSTPLPITAPSAIPVTGTFWQATQPVSGTVAVTGTFWQATQPVSLAAAVAVSTINGVAAAYGTGVRGATVQRVTIATDDVVPASQSGTWNITTLTNLSQFGGAAINLGAGAVGTGTLRITQASDSPLVAAIGATSDAAWATGNGTQIALLKTIAGAAIDTTTASPVKIDQTTPGTTNAVSVQSPADVISYTPTLDTAAYAAGDVLFATAAISGVTRANDLRAVLMSLTAIDKSKNKPAFTLFFFQTNVTSAAANAANTLSDADAVNCLGYIRLASTDWIDLANNSFACLKGINLLLEAATGTTTVYVVGILDAGTPTFAVGDLVLKLGVVQS